jgi:hypothetical protein
MKDLVAFFCKFTGLFLPIKYTYTNSIFNLYWLGILRNSFPIMTTEFKAIPIYWSKYTIGIGMPKPIWLPITIYSHSYPLGSTWEEKP